MTPGERNAYALALEEANARETAERQLQGQIKATAEAEVLLAEATAEVQRLRSQVEGLEAERSNLAQYALGLVESPLAFFFAAPGDAEKLKSKIKPGTTPDKPKTEGKNA